MIEWSLGTAEATVTIAIDLTKPGIVMLDGPIHLIDEILCKSLDMMEEAVPIIKSEPDKVIYRIIPKNQNFPTLLTQLTLHNLLFSSIHTYKYISKTMKLCSL